MTVENDSALVVEVASEFFATTAPGNFLNVENDSALVVEVASFGVIS